MIFIPSTDDHLPQEKGDKFFDWVFAFIFSFIQPSELFSLHLILLVCISNLLNNEKDAPEIITTCLTQSSDGSKDDDKRQNTAS